MKTADDVRHPHACMGHAPTRPTDRPSAPTRPADLLGRLLFDERKRAECRRVWTRKAGSPNSRAGSLAGQMGGRATSVPSRAGSRSPRDQSELQRASGAVSRGVPSRPAHEFSRDSSGWQQGIISRPPKGRVLRRRRAPNRPRVSRPQQPPQPRASWPTP